MTARPAAWQEVVPGLSFNSAGSQFPHQEHSGHYLALSNVVGRIARPPEVFSRESPGPVNMVTSLLGERDLACASKGKQRDIIPEYSDGPSVITKAHTAQTLPLLRSERCDARRLDAFASFKDRAMGQGRWWPPEGGGLNLQPARTERLGFTTGKRRFCQHLQ